MRNLGGAIELALIDTVLYGRALMPAEELVSCLQVGGAGAAIAVGLPPGLVAVQGGRAVDPMALATVSPLVERVAFVRAMKEGWAMLAALMALGLISLPGLGRPS
jgi:DHA2 family multidrug resistance protein